MKLAERLELDTRGLFARRKVTLKHGLVKTHDEGTYSFIADNPFAMNDSNAVPYFEVTVIRLANSDAKKKSKVFEDDDARDILKGFNLPEDPKNATGFVSIGFTTNAKFASHEVPGDAPSSYGYESTTGHQKYVHSSGNVEELDAYPPFDICDVIGCGVMHDSYNNRFVFWTKNGEFNGLSPFRVHEGMDLFPVISSMKRCSYEVNFGRKKRFLWNPSPITEAANPKPFTFEGKGPLECLPEEILSMICDMSVHKDYDASLRLARVSKRFKELSEQNKIWKTLYFNRWPKQSAEIKVRYWQKFYARRHKAELSESQPSLTTGQTAIENCGFEFKCPMAISDMRLIPATSAARRFTVSRMTNS